MIRKHSLLGPLQGSPTGRLRVQGVGKQSVESTSTSHPAAALRAQDSRLMSLTPLDTGASWLRGDPGRSAVSDGTRPAPLPVRTDPGEDRMSRARTPHQKARTPTRG